MISTAALASAPIYYLKMSHFLFSDVCSIRLDFETFSLLGPASTLEADNAHLCQDSFTVTVNDHSSTTRISAYGI